MGPCLLRFLPHSCSDTNLFLSVCRHAEMFDASVLEVEDLQAWPDSDGTFVIVSQATQLLS
jgi:hypothetical protein